MHLYFVTRGTKHLSDTFINLLQGVWFPYPHINPTTKKLENCTIQMNVKPIQLYECVFPEECKDVVFNSLFGAGGGKPQHWYHQPHIFAFKTALGLKEIPEYKKDKAFPIVKDHVEINAIGIKDDYYEDAEGKHYKEKPKDIETHEGL